MKIGDRVQVRRWCDGEHWVFARVQALPKDSDLVRVAVDHPGNPEHEKVLLIASEGVRTKADVLALAEKIKAIVVTAHHQHGLTEGHIQQMGALDGFWLNYITSDAEQRQTRQNMRMGLHKNKGTAQNPIAKHYASIAQELS